MVSIARYIRGIRQVGIREWWHQMQYIGDVKSGKFAGKDQFGNRYFENLNAEQELPGACFPLCLCALNSCIARSPPMGRFCAARQQRDAGPAEWHSWLSHIRKEPPPVDAVMQSVSPPWKAPWIENLTGTRGAYRCYNTVKPKIEHWQPKVTARGK
ncbi:hypothetical protein EWM64_g10824 [Hericium alpestre]|uniref:NADH dehydrogenase [ubiquinone] 1 alpha subcomplex subunit n=1 Tax=Hericium alpestre TaxID=135208 RepID=A0A4Y9ZHD9_9AGAM|nr:hypothetical protein EWM64_g10824 [Hericium alpestre]